MTTERGHVGDKPFARLVYKLARQRFTGDLVLQSARREFRTSWEDGCVVAGRSSSPADGVARVALGAGLATSAVVGAFLQQRQRDPGRDELELFVEIARLQPPRVRDLKRHLLAQRALRIFALPGADFLVTPARSMRAEADVPPLDARWLIFHGVRRHYPIERLEAEMAALFRYRFKLAGDAAGSLPAFGFGQNDAVAIDVLRRSSTSVDELVASCPRLERSEVLSIVYALVACDCLEPAGQAPVARTPAGPEPKKSANNPLTVNPRELLSRQDLERGRVEPRPMARGSGPVKAAAGGARFPRRASTASDATPRRVAEAPTVRRRRRPSTPEQHSRSRVSRTTSGGRTARSVTAADVQELILEKARLVDQNADHFRMLGIAFGADDNQVRLAYFNLAKRLHPDRLQALGIVGSSSDAQRVFAAINQAFAVLSDRRKAAEYRLELEATQAAGSGGVAATEADAEQLAARVFAAEEAFRLGEMALRRNHISEALEKFEQAVELNPDEGEHHAYLAWVKWCAARDKARVLHEIREGMNRAAELSPNSPVPYLLDGHIARQQGDLDRAEKLYRRALQAEPDHIEARSELRLLRQRKRR